MIELSIGRSRPSLNSFDAAFPQTDLYSFQFMLRVNQEVTLKVA